MTRFLCIFIGGGLGSVCRFVISTLLAKANCNGNQLPWATLIANVLGCLLIGLLAGTLQRRGADFLYFLLITGFCGGFTTFSTFSNECFTLLRQGNPALALGYMALSLLCGLLAMGVGYQMMKNA